MLNRIIQFGSNPTIDYFIKLAISIGLLLGLCPLVIVMKDQLPITLQSLIVVFVSIAFGWRIGFPAVLIYLIAGASGLPVFAGYKHGMDSFTGLFGGFFFGFAVASAICGYLTEIPAFQKTIPAILNWFIGHALILLFGGVWLMRMDPDGWTKKILDALPGAVIKSLVGALIIQIIMRLMRKNDKQAFAD